MRKDAVAVRCDPSTVTRDLLHMPVSAVLAEKPAAARVFLERRMGCIGCPFAPFETVAEAARVYGIDAFELANCLASVAGTSEEAHQ